MKKFSIDSKYEYCPNGNCWQDVSGIFDDRLYLFCDCNKCGGKIYELRPIDITKKIKKDVIKRIRKTNELDELRNKISLENLDKIKNKLLTLLGDKMDKKF